MNNLVIRKATSDDLNILLRFEQNIIEAERPFDETLKTDKIHYYNLEEMLSSTHAEIVVAELDGEIIGSGFARIDNAKPYLKHEKYAYLGFMYIAPQHRGKGVNQQIIQALKQWASTQNISEIRLNVYSDNLPAMNAYKKVGFVEHLTEMRLKIN